MPRRTDNDDEDDDDDRPRKKKKKARARPSNRLYWIMGGAVFGVLLLGLVVAFVLLVGFGPGKATAPTQFTSYSPPEEVFQISMPQGWKIQASGKKNYGSVSAEKGTASIRAYESLTGSLLGDIAGAAQGGRNVGDEFLPVSQVHTVKKAVVAEEYVQYKEDAAVTVDSRFGKARRSRFTARGVVGYRATALGALTQITVICTCAPGDWDTLEPAFAKVIASVGPAGAAP